MRDQSRSSSSNINWLAGGLVRYYMALRLSVAAAAPELLGRNSTDAPTPIVRISPAHSGAWDDRECLVAGGHLAVITVPLNAPGVRPGSTIALN